MLIESFTIVSRASSGFAGFAPRTTDDQPSVDGFVRSPRLDRLVRRPRQAQQPRGGDGIKKALLTFGTSRSSSPVRTDESGESLHVRPGASLVDVLRYLQMAAAHASGNMRLVAVREPGGHKVHWEDKRYASAAGKEEARHLFQRLVGRLADGLPGTSPIARAVGQARAWIAGASRLDPERVRGLSVEISEHVRVASMADAPSHPVDRSKSPRPTASCMAHWLDELDRGRKARPVLERQQAALLEAWNGDARAIWLAHAMSSAEIIEYFAAMEQACGGAGFVNLQRVAGELRAESERRVAMKTRLEADAGLWGNSAMRAAEYDNPMGRAFDSALGLYLYEHAPTEMIRAADAFAEAHYRHLKALKRDDPEAFERVARRVQKEFKQNPRFWAGRLNRFSDFVDARRRDVGHRFLKYLGAEVRNADGCMAIYLVHTEITDALKKEAPGHIDWDRSVQDDVDYDALDASRDRIRNKGLPHSRGSGLMLPPDPPLPEDPFREVWSYRSAAVSRPGMVSPTRENEQLLASGSVYASGHSGVAGLNAKGIDQMNRARNANIEMKYAMLGVYMALCIDGGHSLNEVMWGLNQLKPRIDTEVGGPAEAPSTYRADYRKFFDSFPPAVRATLQRAEDYAFDRMLAYRRTSIKRQLRSFSA